MTDINIWLRENWNEAEHCKEASILEVEHSSSYQGETPCEIGMVWKDKQQKI